MQEIKDANAGECFGNDMGKDRGGRAGVHRCELGDHVVELGESVDGDEDLRDIEPFRVPEDHPGCCTLNLRADHRKRCMTYFLCRRYLAHSKAHNPPSDPAPCAQPHSSLDLASRVGKAKLAG